MTIWYTADTYFGHENIIGNHDLEPTRELPWASISHFVELRDGPQNQLNTLCHYPMTTWNHARRRALQYLCMTSLLLANGFAS
ncbi:MAG: hypothetical protein JKY93_03475 [Gammaproteobacteria bacterium]|nr:hypothetical protein [Gammaproteobacteria bacterium]